MLLVDEIMYPPEYLPSRDDRICEALKTSPLWRVAISYRITRERVRQIWFKKTGLKLRSVREIYRGKILRRKEMATKLIGGTDGMHIKPDSHPFQGNGRTPKPKTARTTGVGEKPGGEGSMQSANAEMRKKRPLNGPGTA